MELLLLTGAQIRAARGLLNISVAQLAALTGLAINTIRRAEGTNGIPAITSANMQLLAKTFEDQEVVFLDADEQGVGVRFARPEALEFQSRRRG